MMGNILIQGFKCERCGHEWAPRRQDDGSFEKPKVCAKCKNPYWDRPKKQNTENNKNKVVLCNNKGA